jgi:hypothetical protein
MSLMKQFEPTSTKLDFLSRKSATGISLRLACNQTPSLLADIVENTPIRLLADTLFLFFSEPNGTIKSPLAHLLRYNYISGSVEFPDVFARMASQLDCLITDDYREAKIALLLDLPVWFVSRIGSESEGCATQLKMQWGDMLSIINLEANASIGNAFSWIFLFRLLHQTERSFTPFDGNYQIPTDEGAVSFTSPRIISPWQMDLLLKEPLFQFKSVTIETTSICNLACDYCPNSRFERDKTFMSESRFFRIIDSIADYAPDFSGEIRPHLFGEPLIDNRLEDFVRYTRFRLPAARITLFTNGCFLTTDRFLSLKRASVDMLHISQHQPSPPPGLKETLSHIKSNHPELYTVSYNEEYRAEFRMNRGGLLDLESLPLPDRYYSRCASYRDLTFDVHGNAILCCNDYLGKHLFGNIDKMSVKNIWESPRNSETRNKLFFGLLPLPVCMACMNIIRHDKVEQA